MNTGSKWLLALISLAGPLVASASSVFPIVSIGDTFSGTFYINPSTQDTLPSSCGICYGGTYPTPPSIGNISVQLDGYTFAGAVQLVSDNPAPGYAATWQLVASNPVTVNGTELEAGSGMFVTLLGSNTSTALFPLAFSSYASGLFQLGAATTDQTQEIGVLGQLNFLTPTDSSGDYSFGGAITTIYPGTTVPLLASVWLMLSGLGALGLAARRYR